MSDRRPRLSPRVVDGLKLMNEMADYGVSCVGGGDAFNLDKEERENIRRAKSYVERLGSWYTQRQGGNL